MRIKLLPIFFLLLLSGCAYTFSGGGSVLPEDIKRVYIPLVENSTTEAGLASIVTESLRDQFERYGVLTVVDQANEADAILKARITKVKRSARTTTGKTDSALQYDTSLVMAAELKRISGPLLWRNQNLQVSKSFGTTSNVVVTSSADFAQGPISASDLGGLNSREVERGQEGASLRVLADEIAREMYDQAVAPDF